MNIDYTIKPADLRAKLTRFWELSAQKIDLIRKEYNDSKGSPVFTAAGKYTTRGWTEWTQGFQYGSEILQFDATGAERYLEMGRKATVERMASHVTHNGVHDHGFNNVSTYGALLRLILEGRVQPTSQWEVDFYELALKSTGAVQAMRWTPIADGGGFIYSFNGPHSLFVDTVRTLRALAWSHKLGHVLSSEHDEQISLLGRLITHARATARYSVYYGEGRDAYDTWGRTTHEAVFNTNDGFFRCPNSQQGFSPFTTWTRGLAWAMCGFPEQLEYLKTVPDADLVPYGGRAEIEAFMLKAAVATCDFYVERTSLDGIPFWDTGAPNLHKLGDYTAVAADPYNAHEPVDASAAAIAAQGLIRLGHYLGARGVAEGGVVAASGGQTPDGKSATAGTESGAENVIIQPSGQIAPARKPGTPASVQSPRPLRTGTDYLQAGLTVARTLLDEPYLSTRPDHQGLLLHSVYHKPNGWDFIPPGHTIECGESSMWGDYHVRELMHYIGRIATNETYYTFFGLDQQGVSS
jgi:unsaturated chondroitin disaccharide hydrolase